MSERYDRLAAIVEAQPLEDRLTEIRGRISAMIREKRPPSMRIPAEPTDDDLFISNTADAAVTEITRLRADLAAVTKERDELRTFRDDVIVVQSAKDLSPDEGIYDAATMMTDFRLRAAAIRERNEA